MTEPLQKPDKEGGPAPLVPPASAVPGPPAVPPPPVVPRASAVPPASRVPPASKVRAYVQTLGAPPAKNMPSATPVPPLPKIPSPVERVSVPQASVVPPASPVPPATKVPPYVARIFTPVQPAPRKRSLLTPAELERFRNLLVFARSTVEGYFVGKHKSPHRGSSVEFTDYKEYVAGDEVNRIDWRAYGRSRRLFVRQYEAETDMVVYLLVDVSASMSYAGAGRQQKYLVAAKIAAALSYLMIQQGDKPALVSFSETLNRYIAPGGTRAHLHNLVTELEDIEPASTTGIARALNECNTLFKKRGRIVILSDFWTDTAELLDSLAQFAHRKFEILLLHVLDPDELELPLANAAQFQDMETGEQLQVELEEIRSGYKSAIRERIEFLAREANNRRASHAVVDTRRPYLHAIEAYLGFRGRNGLSVG